MRVHSGANLFLKSQKSKFLSGWFIHVMKHYFKIRGSKKESEQYDQYFLNFEFILQNWHSQSDWRLLQPIRLFKFGRTCLCFDFWWIQCYKMWAFWVQLLQFFLENAILKWKLALIQKCIVIFEIVYNEKHGKWYNLLTLLRHWFWKPGVARSEGKKFFLLAQVPTSMVVTCSQIDLSWRIPILR